VRARRLCLYPQHAADVPEESEHHAFDARARNEHEWQLVREHGKLRHRRHCEHEASILATPPEQRRDQNDAREREQRRRMTLHGPQVRDPLHRPMNIEREGRDEDRGPSVNRRSRGARQRESDSDVRLADREKPQSGQEHRRHDERCPLAE